jgi:hypothetical protein
MIIVSNNKINFFIIVIFVQRFFRISINLKSQKSRKKAVAFQPFSCDIILNYFKASRFPDTAAQDQPANADFVAPIVLA